jgi:hypothetical protein
MDREENGDKTALTAKWQPKFWYHGDATRIIRIVKGGFR